MNHDSPDRPSDADTMPPSKPPGPNQFRRQTKAPRAPSGRILAPAPAWMMKPLKPPGTRFPTDGR